MARSYEAADFELLVVAGDPASDDAIALLAANHVPVTVTRVAAEDYLNPREVPKLVTGTGMYIGLASIGRIVRHELR